MIFLLKGATDGHICEQCYISLEHEVKITRTIPPTPPPTPASTDTTEKRRASPTSLRSTKRHRSAEHPPAQPASQSSPRKRLFQTQDSRRKKQGNIPAITTALMSSKYHRALRHILARSPLARMAFHDVVKEQVKKEVRQYVKATDNNFPTLAGTKSIQEFSWDYLLSDMGTAMPTLAAAVKGGMPVTHRFVENNYSMITLLVLKSVHHDSQVSQD